jgi:hypothetical protein
MTRGRSPTRRGAALLIALATLLLVATGTATLARLASTARAQQIFTDSTVVADDLLRATERPILAWLTSESAEVVLPADSEWPCVNVLCDSWAVDDTDYELCVTAWDQCGLVPMGIARSGSPLRSVLPDELRQTLDDVTIPRDTPPGLDSFLEAARSRELLVFPMATPETRSDVPCAMGGFVATHHSGLVNLNTAPIDLLEAALRVAGRGGLDQIVAARTEQRLLSLAALPRTGDPSEGTLRMTAASNAWGFRVNIRVGPLRRSWWSVYVKQGANRWECAQRLAIPE